MTIIVLDYCTGSCDVLKNVDYGFIEDKYEGNVELYLSEHCDYRLSDINYMCSEETEINYIDKSCDFCSKT